MKNTKGLRGVLSVGCLIYKFSVYEYYVTKNKKGKENYLGR